MNTNFLRIYTILCIAISLNSGGCENAANAGWCIRVKNESEKEVYFVLGFDVKNNSFYPTTRLPNDSTRLWDVKPNQQIPLDYSLSHVKINSGDSIALFVFAHDTLEKYTWKQLEGGEKYLKKYKFKCDELNCSPTMPVIFP